MPKSKINKGLKIVLILTVVFGIIFVAFSGYLFFTNQVSTNSDVLALVGDKKITKDDLNQKIYSVNFSKDKENPSSSDEEKQSLLDELILQEIVEKEAASLGISISDEEVGKELKNRFESLEGYTEDQVTIMKKAIRQELLLEEIKKEQIGSKSGNKLFFYFHKYYETNNESYKTEGQGDEVKIQAQKDAALQLANEIKTKLRNKDLTYDSAKDVLRSDPNLGVQALLPRSPALSGTFTSEDNDFTEKSYFSEAIQNMKKGEVSEAIVDKGVFGEFGDTEKEYRYAIFIVNESKDGIYPTYRNWLDSMYKKYKVTQETSVKETVSRLFSINKAYAYYSSCRNKCSSDNADIEVELRYWGTDGAAHQLRNQNFIVCTGTSTDPLAASNDGSNCGSPNPVRCVDFNSDRKRNGNETAWGTNLCAYDRSFYCSSGRVAYINLPKQDNPDTPKTNGADAKTGNWFWVTRESVDSTEDSWRTRNNGTTDEIAQAKLNLNEDENCEGDGNNGELVTNGFYFDHNYMPISRSLSPGSTSASNPEKIAETVTSITLTMDVDDYNDRSTSSDFTCSEDTSRNDTKYSSNVDKVKGRFQYRYKSFSDTAWGSWTVIDYANNYGLKPANFVDQFTDITANLAVSPGYYEWRTQGQDEHGAENKTNYGIEPSTNIWTGTRYFQVGEPPTPSSNAACRIIGENDSTITSETPVTVTFEAFDFKSVSEWQIDSGLGTSEEETINTSPVPLTIKKTFTSAVHHKIDIVGKDNDDNNVTGTCDVRVEPTTENSSREVKP